MKNLDKKNNLSIVIVNFNAGDFLQNCLQSLEKVREDTLFDVWVVDNASQDGSIEKAKQKFPQNHYIENKENLGFGKANNIALRQIKTEYVLFLNPDAKVLDKTLEFMLNYLDENPDVGAATCKVEKMDGSLDWASHRGFPTPWASFMFFLGDDSLYHLTEHDLTKAHEVDAISGAFFMTRKSVLDKVGLFDEDYFLYAEDIDLCFRIKQAGFKVMYVPEVKILHLKGVSSGIKKESLQITTAKDKSRKRALDSFYQTMVIFYQKHLAKDYPFFINWLVYLGINFKWFLAKRKMEV